MLIGYKRVSAFAWPYVTKQWIMTVSLYDACLSLEVNGCNHGVYNGVLQDGLLPVDRETEPASLCERLNVV